MDGAFSLKALKYAFREDAFECKIISVEQSSEKEAYILQLIV